MAVSYIGASGPSGSVHPNQPNAITPPADIGDLLLFFGYYGVTTATLNAPTGFTTMDYQGSSSGGIFHSAWKRKEAGETSYQPSVAGGAATATFVGWIEVYRGHRRSGNPMGPIHGGSFWAVKLPMGPITAGASVVEPGGALIVAAGRSSDITSQTVLSGDGLSWATLNRMVNLSGYGAGMVSQFAINNGTSIISPSDKTITTTGVAEAGRGAMHAIRPHRESMAMII